jgi:hypothetical protein
VADLLGVWREPTGSLIEVTRTAEGLVGTLLTVSPRLAQFRFKVGETLWRDFERGSDPRFPIRPKGLMRQNPGGEWWADVTVRVEGDRMVDPQGSVSVRVPR